MSPVLASAGERTLLDVRRAESAGDQTGQVDVIGHAVDHTEVARKSRVGDIERVRRCTGRRSCRCRI